MRILIPFSHRVRISHFSHFCTFFAYLAHFSHTFHKFFGEITTKKVEKVRKCEKVRCECDAKIVRCNAMSFYKKSECDAKKFSHYHPWQQDVDAWYNMSNYSRLLFGAAFPVVDAT
jgi:hypothetical protein